MFHRCRLTVAAILALGSLTAGASHAADDAVTAKSRAEVQKILDAVAKATADGADDATISRMMYSDNITIIGASTPGATHGQAAAVADVKSFNDTLGAGASCGDIKIQEPVVASATTFSSFMALKCKTPNSKTSPQGSDVRMLYVWHKLPVGWRCVLEFWSMGAV